MIKTLLSTLFLLIANNTFTQSKDCWKCILYSEKDDYANTYKNCSSFINNNKTGKSVSLAKFILAREEMNAKAFQNALSLLSEVESNSPLFQGIISSLKGDCLFELNRYEKAMEQYKLAIQSTYSELTPYYLYKAATLAKKQGEKDTVQYYLRTLKNYFPSYLEQRKTGFFLEEKLGDFLKLNPKILDQPNDMGYGTVFGKKISTAEFDERVKTTELALGNLGRPRKEINRTIWNTYTNELLIAMESDKSGIRVSDEEITSYLLGLNGFSIQSEIANSFRLPETNSFDSLNMRKMLTQLKSANTEEWQNLKKYYSNKRLYEKLYSIYTSVFYLTSTEKEELKALSATTKTITYVYKPYRSIPNESIGINPEELKSYFNEVKYESKYNVFNEEREVIIISMPKNGENNSAFFKNIQNQLKTIQGGYEKVDTFTKIVQELNLSIYRFSIKKENAGDDYPLPSDVEKYKIRELMFSENSEVGDLINFPIPGENVFKIAILASIKYRNQVAFECNGDLLKLNFIELKKSEKISAELEKLDLKNMNSYDIRSDQTEINHMQQVIPGYGREPEVIAYVFNKLSNNAWSPPISGRSGVFRVKVTNTKKLENLSFDEFIAAYKLELKNRAQFWVTDALKKSAQIIDNRWFNNLNVEQINAEQQSKPKLQKTDTGINSEEGVDILPSLIFEKAEKLSFGSGEPKFETNNKLDLSADFTISFRVKQTKNISSSSAIGHGALRDELLKPGPEGKALLIGFNESGHFYFSFYGDGLETTKPVSDKKWHTYVCSYNSQTRERIIYLDGRLIAKNIANTPYLGKGKFYIGGTSWEVSNFEGMISSVKVYNRLLALDEL